MKNNISILFRTRNSKASKNGLVPIYLRITIDGARLELSTSKFVEKSKWSTEMRKMKGNSEEARSINSHLDILKNNGKDYELPIKISIEDIKTKYFKDKHEIKHKGQIHITMNLPFFALCFQ